MKRNHYVSVMVNGQLMGWTGRNPEKFPIDRRIALLMAEMKRSRGFTAYAVEVKEILMDDVKEVTDDEA